MTIIYGAIRLRDRGKQSDRPIEKITGKVRGDRFLPELDPNF